MKGILEVDFEDEVKSSYHDWNYKQNTGMITIEFESNVKGVVATSEETPILKDLINEVNRISIIVQKNRKILKHLLLLLKCTWSKEKGFWLKLKNH